MLDVCFGDSECGALKYCLEKKEVTYSYMDLNMGKLSDDYFLKVRKEFIDDFFCNCNWFTRYNICKKTNKRFNKIIKTAKKDKELRIWAAGNSVSKCGFYHLIHSLKNIQCDIYVIELPDYESSGLESSWGGIDVFELKEHIQDYLNLQRKLNEEELNQIAVKWDDLIQANGSLRINVDGNIASVDEDYFDEYILNCAPEGEYKLARHVGTTMGQCKHFLYDSFIANRIEFLISKGKIKIVKKADDGDRMNHILKKVD